MKSHSLTAAGGTSYSEIIAKKKMEREQIALKKNNKKRPGEILINQPAAVSNSNAQQLTPYSSSSISKSTTRHSAFGITKQLHFNHDNFQADFASLPSYSQTTKSLPSAYPTIFKSRSSSLRTKVHAPQQQTAPSTFQFEDAETIKQQQSLNNPKIKRNNTTASDSTTSPLKVNKESTQLQLAMSGKLPFPLSISPVQAKGFILKGGGVNNFNSVVIAASNHSAVKNNNSNKKQKNSMNSSNFLSNSQSNNQLQYNSLPQEFNSNGKQRTRIASFSQQYPSAGYSSAPNVLKSNLSNSAIQGLMNSLTYLDPSSQTQERIHATENLFEGKKRSLYSQQVKASNPTEIKDLNSVPYGNAGVGGASIDEDFFRNYDSFKVAFNNNSGTGSTSTYSAFQAARQNRLSPKKEIPPVKQNGVVVSPSKSKYISVGKVEHESVIDPVLFGKGENGRDMKGVQYRQAFKEELLEEKVRQRVEDSHIQIKNSLFRIENENKCLQSKLNQAELEIQRYKKLREMEAKHIQNLEELVVKEQQKYSTLFSYTGIIEDLQLQISSLCLERDNLEMILKDTLLKLELLQLKETKRQVLVSQTVTFPIVAAAAVVQASPPGSKVNVGVEQVVVESHSTPIEKINTSINNNELLLEQSVSVIKDTNNSNKSPINLLSTETQKQSNYQEGIQKQPTAFEEAAITPARNQVSSHQRSAPEAASGMLESGNQQEQTFMLSYNQSDVSDIVLTTPQPQMMIQCSAELNRLNNRETLTPTSNNKSNSYFSLRNHEGDNSELGHLSQFYPKKDRRGNLYQVPSLIVTEEKVSQISNYHSFPRIRGTVLGVVDSKKEASLSLPVDYTNTVKVFDRSAEKGERGAVDESNHEKMQIDELISFQQFVN